MKLQEYMVEATERAFNEFFRYAKAVSADKFEHAPEGCRSALQMCREIVMTPVWAIETIEGTSPEYNEEYMAKLEAEQAQWKTVEDCQQECAKRLQKLYALFRSIGDDRLSETKFLPYEGGRDFTIVEMMEYPRWNAIYHTGQIAYIQLGYGDKAMY